MNASSERISMALAEPFEIARGVQTDSENVVVELSYKGVTGVVGTGARRN
ncbi:MAG: hypothetical protein U5K28_02245 [Halobacteriales archaeon]|nr:hypothetical protein [Halobacteriales archaeon]